ncbi:MAG TPA: glycoside hydrolase family 3 protein, partial [Steroidobacteraceae bacterium]|nr:glycoside hydrolase family 3 protein [Steroidobacteraceae bacterium]
DLRHYPLGSILAGGDPAPLGGDVRAPARAWLELTRAFRGIARERRAGHVPIPLLFGIDAAHGIGHVRGATLFPQAIGLGAMYDPDLIRRVGDVTAQEASALGMNWVFTPTVAVPQDLRWGRTYEAFSADPARVRRDAAAMVEGVQGNRDARVAASAKHFLGDGATTGGIDRGDAAVSERQLIDVHVQGYLAAIGAGVMTVMVSYSSWQGVPMHGNRSLLTGVLKQRLGFDGVVIGDWNGHNLVDGCSSVSCPGAFNAGLDMFMAPDSWQGLFEHTLAQLRSGEIARARLDDAVRRILRVKFKLGLFDSESRTEGRLELLGAAQHRALARQAVRESLVLLKNAAHVLPIRGGAHVLVAGSAADDIGQQCGGWTLSWQGARNHNGDFPRAQSIYSGLAEAIEAGGGSVELSPDGRFARRPDVAVVIYGEPPYAERLGDRASLVFDDPEQLALLQRLRAAQIPIVSVFLSGRPLQVDEELNASDAFVAAWLPGSEGGGVADLLIGDARGAPRHDFRGTLSYAWPSGFALGFGLRY